MRKNIISLSPDADTRARMLSSTHIEREEKETQGKEAAKEAQEDLYRE